MNTTEQELMKYIEEEDVKFIRLTFCDIYGVQKNISIQRSELARAFEKGIEIDASYIDGFGGDYGKDIWLHPEPDTVTILPWRPEHGKVVRMFCTLTCADGTPVETDTRALLRQAVRYANANGLRFHFKSEMQFYLFKTDDNGESKGVPYDNAMAYFPSGECVIVFYEKMQTALFQMIQNKRKAGAEISSCLLTYLMNFLRCFMSSFGNKLQKCSKSFS